MKGELGFTSVDKLYLLSGKEVWNTTSNDTATTKIRQLDYYNYSCSFLTLYIKGDNKSDSNSSFEFVIAFGNSDSGATNNSYGVYPVFRIELFKK